MTKEDIKKAAEEYAKEAKMVDDMEFITY
jgi:hypothetical protein